MRFDPPAKCCYPDLAASSECALPGFSQELMVAHYFHWQEQGRRNTMQCNPLRKPYLAILLSFYVQLTGSA